MRGQFSQWRRRWQCVEQTGGDVGQTQHHGVTVGDKDIAHTVRARAGREQRKAAPEERMGGISDLDFRRIVYRWVVDRGIKMYGRWTPSSRTSACMGELRTSATAVGGHCSGISCGQAC